MDYHERKEAEDVLRRYRRLLEEQAQLASLLSCEPGEVVERVRALREVLDSLVMACELPGEHCEIEQALPAARAALAPSRPASEPAPSIWTNPDGSVETGPWPAPPASVAEQVAGPDMPVLTEAEKDRRFIAAFRAEAQCFCSTFMASGKHHPSCPQFARPAPTPQTGEGA